MTFREMLAVLLFAAGQPTGDFGTTLDEAFTRDVLIVAAARHACHRFDVYLAVDMAQKQRGLMQVRELPSTSGMLFVYEASDLHSMWMKNTLIPLDIAFAQDDGRIVNIARHTEPLSLRSIAAAAPVTYVLELNAGVTERLAIEPGSRLLWGPTFER
jgi:uncharacterized membrane protein (UPF0127 family)